MEGKLLAVALVVMASGCAHTTGTGGLDTGTSSGSGNGLEIKSFGITDQTLNPGQSAIVRARLKNHHTGPVEIEDISLYNTGFLEASKKGCSPSSIQPARKDFAPEMECSWNVEAPEDLKGFESKSITIQMNLRYQSSLTNEQEPMKVLFRPLEDIKQRNPVEKSYSNGEVSARISYEEPVPQQGGMMSFSFKPAGNGRVDSDYTVSYRPSELFSDCPTEVETIEAEKASFSCDITADSAATRNLVFSTSYKYVKSPSLDIEVVRP